MWAIMFAIVSGMAVALGRKEGRKEGREEELDAISRDCYVDECSAANGLAISCTCLSLTARCPIARPTYFKKTLHTA